jgi:hypothetical protein
VSPLFAAVADSTTLHTLLLSGNRISRDCARDVVLPAVLANASLLTFNQPEILELVEAEEEVAERE